MPFSHDKSELGGETPYGLVHVNPMAEVRSVKAQTNEPQALQVADIQPFHAVIAASKQLTLIDVVDVCLGTVLRAWEALSLRWVDVVLDEEHPRIFIRGTIVYNKEKGNHRQDKTKTTSSRRVIQLPEIASDVLRKRHALYAEHLEMVFPSARGTYIYESNFNKLLRKHRKGTAYDWVTVHSIRKTLASIVSENLDSKAASDVLGHADSRLTERIYIAKTDKDVPIGDVVNQALKEARKVSKKSPNKEAKEEE